MSAIAEFPTDAKRIEIPYRPYLLQKQVHDDQHRIRVVRWGRRGGKSLLAIIEGFCMSYDALRAGVSKPRGIITAPTNQMLRENWWAASHVLKQAIVQPVISELRLDLGGLGQIDFRSTESQGGAGRGGGDPRGGNDEGRR